jgi:hypothetical protein
MGFAEAFAQCMQNAGLQADAGLFPDDAGQMQSIADQVKGVYDSLDDVTKQALEAISTDKQGAYIFTQKWGMSDTDPLVQVINQSSGWPIQNVLEYCYHCIQEAAAAAENEGSETQGQEG